MTSDASIVSCDVVGHGLESDHALQVERVKGLNECVRITLDRCPAGSAVWASGGDGGHVAFLAPELLPEAVDLMLRLRAWAAAAHVRLRLTCHRGSISTLPGADGRVQLVGDGINLCGSLVALAPPNRVMATAGFRDHYMDALGREMPGLAALKFGSLHTVYLKHFNARSVCLLELDDAPQPPLELERTDHRHLREAARAGSPWRVVYHLKRLFQVDSGDPQAQKALNDIQPARLSHGHPAVAHPLLSGLHRPALAQFLLASELVERDDGDVICQRDDSGDSMFIVLKGEIGVVTQGVDAQDSAHRPSDIRIGEGGIVGELALALHRPRTATLQAVGETAFLATHYAALTQLLQLDGGKTALANSFNRFLESRVVEHLCRHVPYLNLGYANDDERAADPSPWDRAFDGAKIIDIAVDKARSIRCGGEPVPGDMVLEPSGLYVLASGDLLEASENRTVPKRLSGERFDIVFARLPGSVVDVGHDYRIDTSRGVRRATLVQFSERALHDYGRDRFQHVVAAVRQRLARQMSFDVFISYTGESTELALRWKDALEQAGLAVYMNSPSTMTRFEAEIDLALKESRVLLPIISRAALDSDWVDREIDKRKGFFDVARANILPIETTARLAEKKAEGFTPILAGPPGSDQERAAMALAIDTILAVRNGDREPPVRTQVEHASRTGPAR